MRKAKALKFSWQSSSTPAELQPGLEALATDYPLRRDASQGCRLRFERLNRAGHLRVVRQGAEALIQYSEPALAFRGLGALLAGLVPADQPFEQELPFRTCGIMLECSRNAVSQVAYLKQWLRRMALLGYNWVMLYTKDIYELPAEPYFGYLRGRYTLAEIQELDAYAAALGIEMSACLQALGHLEPVLKWPAYAMIRDTSSVMMVGKEESYQLVEKMIQFWSRALRSRRIHVGMDETHDLGRGRYLDLHGYRRGFDLFNTHLRRVVRICRSYDLQPMIWSDMYFRLGSRNMDYYDPQSRIPQDVVRRIPRQVNLVYWDYYHADKNFYLEWIERHRRMGFEPVMASGIWTWGRLWHDASLTSANAGACLEACRQTGIRDVFFTMWGDDGNYCDFDSALAGLVFVAEKAITGQTRPAVLAKWLQAISGAQYKVTQMASQLNSIASGPAVLWDDPLLGIYLHNLRATRPAAWAKLDSRYRRLALQLAPWRQETGAGSIEHAWRLANLLALKTRLHRQLCTAYFNQDRRALSRIRRDIPAVMTALAEVADSFRTNWLRRYKPFGLEVLQIRLAGLQARLAELTDRLDDYQAGRIEVIEELEANRRAPRGKIAHPSYQNLATASYFL